MNTTFSEISQSIQSVNPNLSDLITQDQANLIINNLLNSDIPNEEKSLLPFSLNSVVGMTTQDALNVLYNTLLSNDTPPLPLEDNILLDLDTEISNEIIDNDNILNGFVSSVFDNIEQGNIINDFFNNAFNAYIEGKELPPLILPETENVEIPPNLILEAENNIDDTKDIDLELEEGNIEEQNDIIEEDLANEGRESYVPEHSNGRGFAWGRNPDREKGGPPNK